MKVIIIVIFLLYFIHVVALPLPYGHYKIIFFICKKFYWARFTKDAAGTLLWFGLSWS